MRNANVAHWMVSITSLGVAAASLTLWTRAGRGDQHEMVLRDEDGNARIRLAAMKTGARIELLGEKERVLASLSQDASNARFVLNRSSTEAAGIELVVPNDADSVTSRARVTVRSHSAGEVATLAAGIDASVELLSGNGGNLELTQSKTQARINAVSAYNWATLEVENESSKFSTKKPFGVDSGVPTGTPSPN